MASGRGSGREGRGDWQERMQSMSPEERAAMRAKFAGAASAARRPPQDVSPIRNVYIIEDPKNGNGKPILKPVKVRIGISDGKDTEILDGLKEGEVVAIGVSSPTLAGNQNMRPPGSPFGGPFGGGFRPR
jgi:hypothetical protein